MKKIAFFGLGAMGLPIARNLVLAGYSVTTAIHRNRAGAENLAEIGGIIAPSIAAAVRDSDVVITIVSDDAAICDLLLKDEMLNHIKKNSIIIDMTTCSAEGIRKIADCYKSRGIEVIDAPLSGGVSGAQQGTMTIMAAGTQEAITQVQDIFSVISSQVFYLGPVGNGKKIKALNNLLAASHIAIAGEVCRMAKEQKIDLEKFYEVINQSSGNSVQFQMHFKQMAEENFEPNFTVALMRKDVGLALDLGKEIEIPLSTLVYSLYEQAKPFDEEDCSAVMTVNQRGKTGYC